MLVTWLLATLVLGSLLALWRGRRRQGQDVRNYSRIPGPPGLPLIGNGLDFFLKQVALFYKTRALANEFPDIYRVQVLDKQVVALQNPTDIEAVLSSSKHNEKGYIYSFLRPWLQEGLLLSDGSKWHARRKILTPAFHFNILRHFSHVLEESSSRLLRTLATEALRPRTDLVPIVSSYTLHSICETSMGTSLHDQSSTKTTQYEKAVHELGETIVKRITCFWLHPTWLFNLSGVGARQRKTLEEVRSFPKRVIEERRIYRQQYGDDVCIEGAADDEDLRLRSNGGGGKKRMAMLDLLLSAERDGLIDSAGIQEEVDTFMFEGHDTTSSGLCYTLLLLANNQDPQEKVVKELDGIYNGSERPATMADFADMKYLEACIKESLRLYPPVPFIARRLGEELVLKDYTVPAGTQCHINIFDLHRRADLYNEPLQFRPERFMSDRGDIRHPYAYIPFSAGSRNCIGQKLAMMELKCAVSALLRRYRLLPVTAPADLVFISDLVLRVAHPVYVQIVDRK